MCVWGGVSTESGVNILWQSNLKKKNTQTHTATHNTTHSRSNILQQHQPTNKQKLSLHETIDCAANIPQLECSNVHEPFGSLTSFSSKKKKHLPPHPHPWCPAPLGALRNTHSDVWERSSLRESYRHTPARWGELILLQSSLTDQINHSSSAQSESNAADIHCASLSLGLPFDLDITSSTRPEQGKG